MLLWKHVVLAVGLVGVMGCEAPAVLPQINAHMGPERGLLRRVVRVGDREVKYSIFVPKAYSPDHAWPTILYFHGLGGHGRDGVSQVGMGIGSYLSHHADDFRFIVVFPQSEWDWNKTAQDIAMAALEDVETQYHIDPDRVSVMGLSRGGYGAYMTAARFHDRFCSLVVMSGPAAPAAAPELTSIPVRCFHYEWDPWVPHFNAVEMVNAISGHGGFARLQTYPGLGHYAWDLALTPDLFDWMAQQRRVSAAVAKGNPSNQGR